jgi:hypothetical protein
VSHETPNGEPGPHGQPKGAQKRSKGTLKATKIDGNDPRGAKRGPYKNHKEKSQYYLVNNMIQKAKLQYYLINNTVQKSVNNTIQETPKAANKQAPEALQKGPAKLYAKRYSLYPRTIQKVTPEGPTTGAKIHQKSHFGASGTPQLQPTGSRDAQEGVNHPNWSQKSSKNDPRTLKSRPKILSEKPTACQKKGRRQWA